MHITWQHLGDEQIMFPLAMRDIPVRIGADRQLFVDNYLIAESDNVRRQVHQPRRHLNPVLTRGDKIDRVFVLQAPKFDTSPNFRMWYWSWMRWNMLVSG